MPNLALDHLLGTGHVWQGRALPAAGSPQPTGSVALDGALPGGGWPPAALSEILTASPGLGEIRLLWPTLARLTRAAQRVILVAPPYIPCARAWQDAGVDLRWLVLVQSSRREPHEQAAQDREALWTAEQCLRSGSCAAVLCWPSTADDKALRRLQVAAGTGQCLGFAYRPLSAAHNPSPAALRLAMQAPGQVRILKCRGGLPPAQALAWE